MLTIIFLTASLIALGAFTSPERPQAPATASSHANPLVVPWSGPYGGVPPWDQAKPELFPAAFEAALADRRAEIDAIASSSAPPTFENTIAALERSGDTLDRVAPLFAVLRQNVGTPEIQALDREWQPRLSAAEDAITFNPGLFKRIEAVHRLPAASGLTPEQKRLTERTYDSFVRRGARLDEAQKGKLSGINQQLAALFSEFRAKVLADENTWTVLEGEADTAGLPASMVSAARAAAPSPVRQ